MVTVADGATHLGDNPQLHRSPAFREFHPAFHPPDRTWPDGAARQPAGRPARPAGRMAGPRAAAAAGERADAGAEQRHRAVAEAGAGPFARRGRAGHQCGDRRAIARALSVDCVSCGAGQRGGFRHLAVRQVAPGVAPAAADPATPARRGARPAARLPRRRPGLAQALSARHAHRRPVRPVPGLSRRLAGRLGAWPRRTSRHPAQPPLATAGRAALAGVPVAPAAGRRQPRSA